MATVEKVEEVKLKIPLGCAMIDLAHGDQQPMGVPFKGPYIVWAGVLSLALVVAPCSAAQLECTYGRVVTNSYMELQGGTRRGLS